LNNNNNINKKSKQHKIDDETKRMRQKEKQMQDIINQVTLLHADLSSKLAPCILKLHRKQENNNKDTEEKERKNNANDNTTEETAVTIAKAFELISEMVGLSYTLSQSIKKYNREHLILNLFQQKILQEDTVNEVTTDS